MTTTSWTSSQSRPFRPRPRADHTFSGKSAALTGAAARPADGTSLEGRDGLDRGGLTLLETLLAVDRPSLGGLEGDGGLLAALGAGRGGFDALALRMIQPRVALGLAV